MNDRPVDVSSEILDKYNELNNNNLIIKFDKLFFKKINKVGVINALSEKSGLKRLVQNSIEPIMSSNLEQARKNVLSQYSYFNKPTHDFSIPQSSHDLMKEELQEPETLPPLVV